MSVEKELELNTLQVRTKYRGLSDHMEEFENIKVKLFIDVI